MINSRKEFDLYEIMQNTSISALALHSFILGYFKISKNKKDKNPFPRMDYLFYVLPIVYHKNSREIFKSSNELYTAILHDKEIILGLQERAIKMAPQTFDGLNLAFSKKLLSYNSETKTIEILKGFRSNKIRAGVPLSADNSIPKIQNSAYKLGHIFAKNTEKNIQIELNIRF